MAAPSDCTAQIGVVMGHRPFRAAALYACGTEPAYGRLSRFRLRSLVRRAPGIAAEKSRLGTGSSERVDLTHQTIQDAGEPSSISRGRTGRWRMNAHWLRLGTDVGPGHLRIVLRPTPTPSPSDGGRESGGQSCEASAAQNGLATGRGTGRGDAGDSSVAVGHVIERHR